MRDLAGWHRAYAMRRATGQPSYGQRARAAFPGYVDTGAPCDVGTCGRNVGGSRTITLLAEDGTHMSVLVRLCTEHTGMPLAELRPLLPGLPDAS